MEANPADIGIVTYWLQEESGQLLAKWYHSDLDLWKLGTGVATPCNARGFEGSFDITYYSHGGIVIGTFKLSIA